MKQLFTLIILNAIFNCTFAQKAFYVIDGYTLEPLLEFTAIADDPGISVNIEHNRIMADREYKGNIIVTKAGYTEKVFAIVGKDNENIILEPTIEQKNILRSKYISAPQIDESDNKPLFAVDEMAMFPGEEETNGLNKFLAKNLRYPQAEIEMEIQGRLYVKFVIEIDGSITNISIAKGLTKNTELETIRVLQMMPKWIPAKKEGVAVRSYFNLPISFYLN